MRGQPWCLNRGAWSHSKSAGQAAHNAELVNDMSAILLFNRLYYI